MTTPRNDDADYVARMQAQRGARTTDTEELAAHADDPLLHSSGQEVAYAENATGVTTNLVAGDTDVPGCVIVVPPNPRPVWIEVGGQIDATVAPAAGSTGVARFSVVDDLDNMVGTVYGNFEGGSGVQGFLTLTGVALRIPPDTAQRTYRLRVNRSGAAYTAVLQNGAVSPAWRTWIVAKQA